jgi:dTDP-4-dehydrorhamnose reductase
MTRVLVIGGAGMLGHKLVQTLQSQYDVYSLVRTWKSSYERYGIFRPERTIVGIDMSDQDALIAALARIKPDVMVNCVGIIKQLPTAKDPIVSITVNSLLPHRLAALARLVGSRFFHISTDCVFDGVKGNYSEADHSNATDLYGRSKHLGEVDQEGSLTLRTSIIGRELSTTSGLIEWFLSQRGQKVKGFQRAIYSGLTTLQLSRVMARIIEQHPRLSGLYQVASAPINKFALLQLVRQQMKLAIDIEADEDFVIDRSLNGQRFTQATGIEIPDWPTMIADMCNDATPYEALRK